MRLSEIFTPARNFQNDVIKQFNKMGKTSASVLSCYEEYLKNSKGQMLRPSLIYFTAQLLGDASKTKETLALWAACIELTHLASLLHDDVLDKQLERRGKSSFYKTFGEKSSILYGNLLYIRCFEMAYQNLQSSQILALTLTTQKMCVGELIQSSAEDKNISVKTYLKIIYYKTGYLIQTAMEQAAILVGDTIHVKSIKQLGFQIGILYQLYDDYNDDDCGIHRDIVRKLAQKKIKQSKRIMNEFKKSKSRDSLHSILEYIENVFK